MTSEATRPENGNDLAPPCLDAPLLQWLALQMVQDARARLVEGGAGADADIELATVFVDLNVTVRGERERRDFEEALVIRHVCGELARVKQGAHEEASEGVLSPGGRCNRWLLVGGPGSGKSTATTMVAQLLRRFWVDAQHGKLPEGLRAKVAAVSKNLGVLAQRLEIEPRRSLLPLRVSLPALAQWMVSQDAGDPTALLWRYLAARMAEDAAAHALTSEATEAEVEGMVRRAGQVLWIFDGLDEVPRTAGREKVIAVVRAALEKKGTRAPGLLVTTRPQGYEGELDDLATMVLEPMPVEQARDYGERLLRVWCGEAPDLAGRRGTLQAELERPEIQALVQTPLHTTMATLLVAMRGSLPTSRWLLFDHYFDTIFQRELSKPGDHGFRPEDRPTLRDLHARAGLVLHVRAQAQAGTRPALLRRELREELAAIFREKRHVEEDVIENAERMMRFATERLVLLLHASTGEYSFGIRSLQEFFAADALLKGERAHVGHRLKGVVLDPHWSNVMALVASKCALADGGQGQTELAEYTVGLCRALNDGTVGGEPAKLFFLGSRLAIAMLRETERYGDPWLHDPLWGIAMEAAESLPELWRSWLWAEAADDARERGEGPSIWNDNLGIHVRLGLLAAYWESRGKRVRHGAILQAAERLLAAPPDRRQAGWLLLYGLLLSENADANQLASRNSPGDRDDARGMVTSLLHALAWQKPSAWLVSFVESHLDWFTPRWMGWSHYVGEVEPKTQPFVTVQLLNSPTRAVRLVLVKGAFIHLASLDQSPSTWGRLLNELPDLQGDWQIWRKLAEFELAPSHVALASLLEAAVTPDAMMELQHGVPYSSWPVGACLAFARHPEECLDLARRVRAGDLGTVEDWRAAEVRWRSSPEVSAEDFREWLALTDQPWARSIGSSGVVLLGVFRQERRTDSPDSGWAELLAVLREQIASNPQGAARALWLLERLFSGKHRLVRFLDPPGTVPLSVARCVDEVESLHGHTLLFCVDQLLPDLTGPESDGWFELLDQRGRQGRNLRGAYRPYDAAIVHRQADVTRALIRRLRDRPDQWGLASALLVMLRAAPDTDLATLPALQAPPDAPLHASATIAFLNLLSSDHDAAELTSLVQTLVAAGEDPGGYREMMAEILEQRGHDPERSLAILIAALRESPADSPFHDMFHGALFSRLRRSAQPSFSTADAWSEHALPGPFLSGQEPEMPPPRLVRLVELSNLRLFKETPSVDVPFPVPATNTGQWIILTGENGIGKTTLLRALALVLASPAVASKLLDERLPMIRNGGEGRVAVELDGGLLSAVVRFRERTETVESEPKDSEAVWRPWVVGYGVRRGNARGEQDREPEWGPLGELHTLFDRPASLVNATDWLIKLERQVLREEKQQSKEGSGGPAGERAAIWHSVVQTLKTLLGVTAIEPEDEHVFVQHPHFGRVRLDALSDGYLTTTGWVIDLIARWIDRKRALDEPVGLDMLRRMTGFVLIDEIDLHLHPVWQMRVVDDVRRLFPRLSFVVTTHNPLTLQGARRGEVYVMRREEARVELVQRDIRPGHDVDRVLFEQFGIEHTFDKETRVLLARHREVLENGVRLDDPERVELEVRLAERLGGVGEIVRAERRGTADPLPDLTSDEREFLATLLKKES